MQAIDILITGQAGVGKTMIANEITEMLMQKGGYDIIVQDGESFAGVTPKIYQTANSARVVHIKVKAVELD